MTRKQINKITYILIILATANFCVNIGFKLKAQKNYLELDNGFSQLKLDGVSGTELESLRKLCVPFTYFDETTDLQLEKIIGIMQGGNQGDRDELIVEVNKMQLLLHTRQQKLLMSFDYLMYCSLLLVFIAIVVIIYDLFKARNEMSRVQAVSEEQLKFSRDLHDGVAQDLAALKVYLEKKDDEKSAFYASHALSEVRYLIDSMHRDLSKPLSLAIKETLADFETNFGVTARLMLVGENIDKIPANKQMEIFRILQEALSNIGRHASATEVIVQLTEVGDDLKFNIRDNGVGFQKEMLNQVQQDGVIQKHHYGVKNIEDRVLALGGTMQFINNGGTTIAITIKDFIR